MLGAGASVEAGIPDAYAMTERIVAALRAQPRHPRHSDVVSFVLGGLLFQAGIRGEDPLKCGVNVEDLFNAMLLLSERYSLEAAPFIGSWHSMVEELDKVGPDYSNTHRLLEMIGQAVGKEIADTLSQSRHSFETSHVDDAIRNEIDSRMRGRGTGFSFNSPGKSVKAYLEDVVRQWCHSLRNMRPRSFEFSRELANTLEKQPTSSRGGVFQRVCDLMIEKLIDIAWLENDSKTAYLTPLFNLTRQQESAVIATLNYDNAVERASESSGLECSTGIDPWSATGEFTSASPLRLLKLHGSIDWISESREQSAGMMPQRTIRRAGPDDMKAHRYRPAVVFGQRNKLTAEGPFLDLLRAFQRALAATDRLTVIGYSFRDEHVNVFISQWLNRNPQHRLRVIDPHFSHSRAEYAIQLSRLAKDRIEVLEKDASVGIMDCFGAPSAANEEMNQ